MAQISVISSAGGLQVTASGLMTEADVTRHIADRIRCADYTGQKYDSFVVVKTWMDGLTSRTSVKVYDHRGVHVHPNDSAYVNLTYGRD